MTPNRHIPGERRVAIALGILAGVVYLAAWWGVRVLLGALVARRVPLPQGASIALMLGVPTICMAAPTVWALRPRRGVKRGVLLVVAAWVGAVACVFAFGCWFRGSLVESPLEACGGALVAQGLVLTVASVFALGVGLVARRCRLGRTDPGSIVPAIKRAGPVLVAIVVLSFVGAHARWWMVFGRARRQLERHGATRLIDHIATTHGLAAYISVFETTGPLPAGTAAVFPAPEAGQHAVAVVVPHDGLRREAPQLVVTATPTVPDRVSLLFTGLGPFIPLTPSQYRAILDRGLPEQLRQDLGRYDLNATDSTTNELPVDLTPYLGP